MKRQSPVSDDWVMPDQEKPARRSFGPLSFVPMLSRGRDTIQSLTAEVRRHPDDAGAFERLGIAHANAGDHASAAQALGEAVAIDPARSRAWSALGEARVRVADADAIPYAARDAFEKALALDPEDVRAQFYLAVEKDASGAREEAMGDWLDLLRVVPLGSKPNDKIRAAILASMNREANNG